MMTPIITSEMKLFPMKAKPPSGSKIKGKTKSKLRSISVLELGSSKKDLKKQLDASKSMSIGQLDKSHLPQQRSRNKSNGAASKTQPIPVPANRIRQLTLLSQYQPHLEEIDEAGESRANLQSLRVSNNSSGDEPAPDPATPGTSSADKPQFAIFSAGSSEENLPRKTSEEESDKPLKRTLSFKDKTKVFLKRMGLGKHTGKDKS